MNIYNTDWAVGQGGSNGREDTMLVQALFHILYYEDVDTGCTPPAGSTGIAVDGWYGPATQRHINHWQSQMRSDGENVLCDGVMDPFRGQKEASTISKTRYALELLNNACHNACKDEGKTNFLNLPNRQDIPVELRNALKTVKTTAAKYQYG
ncbi:MAG: peptidoglycan-binding protein [Variovorax sp.]